VTGFPHIVTVNVITDPLSSVKEQATLPLNAADLDLFQYNQILRFEEYIIYPLLKYRAALI
jgi:hypothetical protein